MSHKEPGGFSLYRHDRVKSCMDSCEPVIVLGKISQIKPIFRKILKEKFDKALTKTSPSNILQSMLNSYALVILRKYYRSRQDLFRNSLAWMSSKLSLGPLTGSFLTSIKGRCSLTLQHVLNCNVLPPIHRDINHYYHYMAQTLTAQIQSYHII